MVAVAFMGAKRIRHRGKRFADMLAHHVSVWDIIGDFTKAIHIIGNSKQPCRDIRKE
jgi:hypothetical protein